MVIQAASDVPFGKLAMQMSKMLEQARQGYQGFYSGETWTPSVNLYETESAYLVCVDLAGVDKEKIDLTLVDGRLRLRGVRAVPAPDGGGEGKQLRCRVHLMEIDHGAFTRNVDLPLDVERGKITANYRSGMLWIEIPKRTAPAPT